MRTGRPSPLTYAAAVAVVAGLGALGWARLQQHNRQAAVDAEAGRLKQQVDDLGHQNAQLEQSLSYFSSPEFREKLARQQLNMKRPGEIVFSFPKTDAPSASRAKTAGPGNVEKWVRYFFGQP